MGMNVIGFNGDKLGFVSNFKEAQDFHKAHLTHLAQDLLEYYGGVDLQEGVASPLFSNDIPDDLAKKYKIGQ